MGIHVIIGEDDYLVAEAAKKVVGDGVGLEVIDSLNATNADLQLADLRAADASFSTPPFLDPQKVTWWRNVGFLPQGGRGGPSEVVKTALEKFARKLVAAKMPENQSFVLTGPRMLATSVFARSLKASTVQVLVLSSGKPWEASRAAVVRVREMAAGEGLAFDSGAAEALVARVGVDMRSLVSEVAKLRDYLGPEQRKVTAADVAEISSTGVGVEPALWSVTDAVGARDVAALVTALRGFERETGFGVMMTTVVEKFFRQLVELKDATTDARMAAVTEGLSGYAVGKLRRFLPNWSLRELRVARARFVRLRERCVSSSGSADVLVTSELVRVCARPRAGR